MSWLTRLESFVFGVFPITVTSRYDLSTSRDRLRGLIGNERWRVRRTRVFGAIKNDRVSCCYCDSPSFQSDYQFTGQLESSPLGTTLQGAVRIRPPLGFAFCTLATIISAVVLSMVFAGGGSAAGLLAAISCFYLLKEAKDFLRRDAERDVRHINELARLALRTSTPPPSAPGPAATPALKPTPTPRPVLAAHA